MSRRHTLRRKAKEERVAIPLAAAATKADRETPVLEGGTAGVLESSSGKPVRADPAINIKFGITCVWRRSAWAVSDLGVVT